MPCMRTRNPWKWPLCLGVALSLLLLGVFLIPRSWIFLLPRNLPRGHRPDGVPGGSWLVLTPPPEIEVEIQRPEPDPDESRVIREISAGPDPDWWRRGVQVRIAADGPRPEAGPKHAAVQDSVHAVLEMLGAPPDFLTRSRPDSLLAARLFALKVSDGFAFDQWKPYLAAMARAHDYADIMSRAADMFDDFLSRKIMVPDQGEPEKHSP